MGWLPILGCCLDVVPLSRLEVGFQGFDRAEKGADVNLLVRLGVHSQRLTGGGAGR